MRWSYRSALANAVIWALIGGFWIYLDIDEVVISDVSTWETTTWGGALTLLLGSIIVLLQVYGVRSRTPITDEDLQSTVARVQVWGGEYLITEETVFFRQDQKSTLRHARKQKPLAAGLTLLFVVGTLLGALGMVTSGLVVRILPFSFFLPSLYLFLGSVMVAGSIPAGLAFWQRISIKRRLGTELGTRNLSSDDAITMDAIELVAFDRNLGLPAMYIEHQQSNGTAIQWAYFLRDGEDELAEAELAFRSLDVPVRRIREPFPASSAD